MKNACFRFTHWPFSPTSWRSCCYCFVGLMGAENNKRFWFLFLSCYLQCTAYSSSSAQESEPHHAGHCIASNEKPQRKHDGLSCGVMRFGAECCVWSPPAVCLLRIGVGSQVSYCEVWPYSTGLCTQQVTVAQVRFDPQVSWAGQRSPQATVRHPHRAATPKMENPIH